jgi:hypothetical protein
MQSLADYYKLDKSINLGFHNYIPVYEKKFSDLKDNIKCFFEIGIGCIEKGDMLHVKDFGYKTGNSLRMWRDYFVNAEIHGMDLNPESVIRNEERIITHIGDQSNNEDIVNIINKINKNIDIVIDDGSHNPVHQVKTFQYFHPYLKSNSIYCIEDIFPENIEKFKNLSIFPEEFQDIIRNEYIFEFFDQRQYSNDNSVICIFTKKPKEIYVNGVGGLGNCMFQIATAAYYSEKYNYKIILNNNSNNLHFGTSNFTNRDKRKKLNDIPVSYKNTIFNNQYLTYTDINIDNSTIIHNDNSSNIIYPGRKNKLLISGYCQNYNLFYDIFDSLHKYFNFNDESINDYLIKKYDINEEKHNIMIGIRSCDDFSHMNKITKDSYKKALNCIINDYNYSNYCIFIIADRVDNLKDRIEIPENIEYKIIDEDDITQFYAGLKCSSFILSESTYHYWIALIKYLQNKTTNVYCFDDTDLTNRTLALPEWYKIPY